MLLQLFWMCAILSGVISYFVVRRDNFYDVNVFPERNGSITTNRSVLASVYVPSTSGGYIKVIFHRCDVT